MSKERTGEWNKDELSRVIHDKTWAGELWGPAGAVALAELRFRHSLESAGSDKERAAAYSSLSSTYYTASGNARAYTKNVDVEESPLWAQRTHWYLGEALRLSNIVEKLLGKEDMSHDQLDVRASILRGAKCYKKALPLIEEALERKEVPSESRALLLAGKAALLDNQKKTKEAEKALHEALEVSQGVRGQTQVRIKKAWGRHLEVIGKNKEAKKVYDEAINEAEEMGGMDDQIVKLRSLQEKI